MENTNVDIQQEVEKMEQNLPELELITKDELDEIIDKTKKLFESRNKELETKIYEVVLSKEGYTKLADFFTNDVPWEWSQSIGIIEINKAITNIKDHKKSYFKALAVQAIAFHLSKFKGKGLAEAVEYCNLLLTPFNETMKLVNDDTEKIKKLGEYLAYLDMQMAGSNQGLDIEYSAKIKEIQKELE